MLSDTFHFAAFTTASFTKTLHSPAVILSELNFFKNLWNSTPFFVHSGDQTQNLLLHADAPNGDGSICANLENQTFWTY